MQNEKLSVTISRSLPADFPALIVLYQKIFPQKKLRSADLAAPQSRVWCACAGSQNAIIADQSMLGFVIAAQVLDELQIMDVGVDDSSRRRGIGRNLLQTVLKEGATLGVKKITLEVNTKNNPAVALYRSFGFIEVGRRRGYYADGGDALLMDFI